MTDTQKRLRIYTGHPRIRVMAPLAATGLWFAILRANASSLWLFALGWSIYVIEEHLIHRFIFHAPAPRRQFIFDLLYRLHYGHHDQVRNKHLLFTPLWFTLPLTLANLVVFSLVLPLSDLMIATIGGGICAYLFNEWMHLESHFRTPAKGRLGRYITRRHGKHHQIDYHNWYTVSPGGQLVDSVLGSDPSDYCIVSNVRTCGLDPQDPRLEKSRLRFGTDTSLANETAILAGAMPA